MSVGDWVQSIVGSLGILATLAVARLVLRIERRDRQTEKSVENREAARLQEERRVADQKRHDEELERNRKAARREQHKDDYIATKHALATLDKVFSNARYMPFTREEFVDSGAKDAMDLVHAVSLRIPSLNESLLSVWLAAADVERFEFPSQDAVGYAYKAGENRIERQHEVLRQAARSAASQSQAAFAGMRQVKSARKSLANEWGVD